MIRRKQSQDGGIQFSNPGRYRTTGRNIGQKHAYNSPLFAYGILAHPGTLLNRRPPPGTVFELGPLKPRSPHKPLFFMNLCATRFHSSNAGEMRVLNEYCGLQWEGRRRAKYEKHLRATQEHGSRTPTCRPRVDQSSPQPPLKPLDTDIQAECGRACCYTQGLTVCCRSWMSTRITKVLPWISSIFGPLGFSVVARIVS